MTRPDPAPTSTAEDLLRRCPVVPVVVLDHAEDGPPLAQALLAGGITVAEITLRTAAGLDAIEQIARAVPDLVVGAGSVLTSADADRVCDAGARFVVSPGLHPDVVRRCQARGVPALPGTATASELMQAVNLGLRTVKFFPAGLLGGPAMIAALSAPFPGLAFLPSGGIGPDTMADYLAVPAVPAVSGSWMVDPALIRAGDWAEVTRRSTAAIATATSAGGA